MNAVEFVSGMRRLRAMQQSTHRTSDLVAAWFLRFAAFILLLAISPLMALIAFLIWRVDGAPIFFAHYRVGHDGRLFRCLKFRTMRRDAEQMLKQLLASDPQARAEWDRDQKLMSDPRITPIGHFLRKTSLDELPQIFNVVKGQMHLVGPRPITVAELDKYGQVRWHYFSVRPGITGLWQVSGRNDTTYAERVILDASYVEERSFWMDIRILLKTAKVVFLGRGAR